LTISRSWVSRRFFAPQPTPLLALIAGHALAAPGVDVALATPVPECLLGHAQLSSDPLERRARPDQLHRYRIEAVAVAAGWVSPTEPSTWRSSERGALKLISEALAGDSSFRERFKRESRLAASIRHPNVTTVFHAGEEGGRLYIAMDYIEGSDLKQLIATQGRLDPRLAAGLLSQVAAALDAAHARTLVHSDVKPANVVIAGDEEPFHAYLTDFGARSTRRRRARWPRPGSSSAPSTTWRPSRSRAPPLDARQLLTRLRALRGAREPRPSVTVAAPGNTPEFEGVVARAMAKDAAERYLSAGDLGRAAVAAAAGTSAALDAASARGAAALPPNRTGPTVDLVRR